MNKVFKVIWNQATQSWVAVSELQRAKGKTKSVSEGSKVLLAGAGLALAAVSGNVYAATAITGQTGDGITISTTGGTAASTVTADSIAIGRGAAVKTVGTDPRLGTQAIAIGENAQTRKEYTIAIGGNADGGRQDGSVVIGNSAKGHTNSADNATRHTSYYNPFMPRNTWSHDGQEGSTHLLYSHKGEQQAAGVVSVGYKAEAEYGGVAVGDRAFAGDSSTVNRPEYRGLGVAVGANAWSQDGGVVIGGGAVNERQNGIAIARQAVSKGRSAIAVGVSSVSVGDRSLAVGSSATSLGDNSIAIGASKTSNERYSATDNVQSEGRNSIAMGTQARVGNSFDTTVLTRSNAFGVAADNAELKAWNDRIAAETARVGLLTENSIAMGTEATVLAKDSMAVGTKSNTTGRNAIAIGKESVANNFGGIAIGEKAEAKTAAGNEGNDDSTGLAQTKAIAIGGEAKALHDKTVAVGDRATASGDHSFAMGAQALADKQYATAVGSNSNATGEFATALGKSATASGNFGSAVGVDSKAIGVNSAAVGRLAKAEGTSGLAFGHGATAGVSSATAADARNNAIAIGTNAYSVGGHASIALGNTAKATQNNALAMGTNSNVSVASGTAIGQNTNVSSIHAVALGTGATVDAGFDRSVALGAYSTVSAAVPTNTATVGGITYSGFAGNNPAVGDVVSVGNGDRKRQIQNVAAGRINATSTDAINGSQLYLTQVALDNAAQTTATNFGGGVTVGADGKLTAPTYNLNTAGNNISDLTTTADNVAGALTNLNNYVNKGFDITDNEGAVKGTVTPGEKVQFANGNATTSTVTQEASGITKVQYNVEVDGSTIKVENGKLTAVQAPAATPTKLENSTTTTVTNKGTDAAPVYTVEVNKADVATAPTDTADTNKITVNTAGKVVAPTDATKAGNTFVTAQNLADVVNNSGFTLKTSDVDGGEKVSGDDEVINPSETVEMVAGKNLTVKQEANGKVTYATKEDVVFNSVTSNTVTVPTDATDPSNNPITISKDGISAGDKAITNVASGVNTEAPVANPAAPTAEEKKAIAEAVKNATGDTLTNAVNVGDLQAATNAAKTEVKGSGLATVAEPTVGENGQAIYTVDVAKADAPTVTRGSVTVKADDEEKVMTAGDVAKAITDSERTSSVKAGSKAVTVTPGTEDAKGNTEYVVDVNTDKTITRDAEGKLSVNTGNSLKVDAASGKIDVNTDDKTITLNEAGQVTAVTTNLTNSDKGAVNAPSAEDAGKLVTAQTVADAINKSGFTAKANGDAGELINPGDEVDFINGKNIEITRDGGKFTVATAKDVTFDSVTFGDNGPKITNKDGNINVAGNDGSPTKITGVKAGEADTDAVNVSQLKAAQAKVEATGLATVSSTSDANGTVYTVDVAKADAPTVARGSVTVKEGDENKVMTAGDVAKAITDSERTSSVKAGSKAVTVTAGTEDANGNTEYVVDVNTDKTITRDAEGKLSVNTGNSLKVDAASGKIDVNTDDKTITLNEAGQVTAVTTNLTNSDKGAVNAPSAADAGKLVTAQTVADAINKSGFTLKTSDVDGGEKVSGDDEVINPGETVEMVAGKNLTVKQEANGKVTYATKENVEFSTVKVNDATDPTKGGSVTVGGDEDGIQITSKPSSTAGEKPTNTIANLSNNLVDASKAAEQPSENSPANLGDKLNNAATVSDVLNAGWNLQGNGKAVDTVIHNDTVDFVNGKGTVVTVENKDGKNTIKVDSAIEFVNADANDASTPSDTAKLTGAKPVQLGNVASGVRAEDGTALTGKDLAKAIDNASGDQLTNAVNVGDLQAAAKAAKTEVKGSGLATVAEPTVGENGQAIYTVDVAKADAPTVTDGAVSVKAGDEGKVMVAGDVAKAINESGFKLTATASEGEVEGTSEELINPSDKVTVDAGKNIKLVQDAGKITVATKDDVVFNSVTSNTITVPTDAAKPSNNPITITKDGISAGNKAINNVADGDISPTSKQAINGSQLHNYTKVNGNNIGTDDSGAINIVNGSGTTVTSTKPGEVKVNVNNTNLTVADNGTIDVQDPAGTGAHYVNATTVANAVNNVSWNVNSEKDAATANAATKNTYTAGNNKVKAGETVKVNAGRNIEISGSGKTVNVAVSDNPEFETVKVGKGNNATTISSDADGVRIAKADGSPQRITNVAAGKADTDAVNVGQLKGAVNNLNNKINRNNREARAGIAGSNAAAALPQVYIPGKSMVAAAGGTFKGENALAVGYSRSSDNGKLILKLQGNANSRGDIGGGVGVGYQW